MMGHEQPGRSRSRRLSRCASIASALIVVAAVVVGGAAPAFADPPDAPPQPSVIPFNGAILVSFDTPFDGGSPILSYTAVCTSFDGGALGSNIGGASPIIVGGLTNGSSYTCTVMAHNADGDGPTSPVSDVAMPTTVPDAPDAPTVIPLNASIIVSFDTPFDGGSPITGYSASCTSPDGGVGGSGTGQTSPIAVGSLSNGKTYTCSVSASNANGAGPNSPSSQSTVPNTVPDTPAAPSATAPTSGGIAVSFTAPFDGGSPITAYTVACTSSDGGAFGFDTDVASPITVTNVTAGNTYSCTVVATNANGDSGTSPPSNDVVPGAAPDAPGRPNATPGNSSILVSFVPASTGSTASGYLANCTSSNGGTPSLSNPGAASPILVPGVTNGRTYTCTVIAANGFGPSPASPASLPVVPKSVPARPGPPSVAAANQQIRVAFHAPSNGGFAITKYRVYCGSTNGGVTRSLFTTGLAVWVTGVTNGKSYRCNITAYSSVGASPVSGPSVTVIPHSHGFRVFTGDGGVFVFGDAPYYGSVRTRGVVIAMMTTPDNHGYWLVTQNGIVYPFGDARSYGSLAGHHLNRPIVGGTATHTGHGYWLVASDGGIFAFGDARFFGSTGNKHLAQPIVGMTPTASGNGYWFVAADGGMFAFGDARFFGSAAGRVNARTNPIVGMGPAVGGTGYWLATFDGAVFGFGSGAPLAHGKIAGLASPITGIAPTDSGRGYWLTSAAGHVYVTGDAPYIGWAHVLRLSSYIRGISR